MREQAEAFARTVPYCVIATVGPGGSPEAATVAFAQTDSFELIIGTNKNTRKSQNIARNPKVAVVITKGWETLQLQASARILATNEVAPYAKLHYTKHPDSRAYAKDPDERYILLTPHWLRYSNFDSDPAIIQAIQL